MSHQHKSVVMWDDLRTPANATSAIGSNPPTYQQFINDGLGNPVDYAIALGGTSEISVKPGFIHPDTNHNISLWFKTNDTGAGNYWVWHYGDFDTRVQLASNQQIRIARENETNVLLDGNWLVGAKNHLSINIFASGGSRFYEVYINGQLQDSYTASGVLQVGVAPSELTFGRRPTGSTEAFSGIFDDIRVYSGLANNRPLSQSEIAELYNDGNGRSVALNPSNATELAWYPMNAGAGSTIDNAEGTSSRDLSLTNLGTNSFWVSGLIGGGTRGVFGYHFNPSVTQEVYFDVQLPHGYKEGSDLYPHVHWSPKVNGSADQQVVWGLEFTKAGVGQIYGLTQTISGVNRFPNDNPIVAYKHYATSLGAISGSGLSISSMLKCRLYRKTSNVVNNFPYDAVLHEFDVHVQLDTRGSDEEFEKHGI